MFKSVMPLLILISCLIGSGANASSTRSWTADSLQSSNGSFTQTIPAVTGTLETSAGIFQETPSGTVNGSNTSFTLVNTPVASTLSLVLDGLTLIQGAGKDYTISGTTITMATAPATAQKLYATYSKY
jgi:hypothetical protein